MMTLRRKLLYGLSVAALLAGTLGAWYWRDTSSEETARLATLLEWVPGRVIGEIGAGEGQMTTAAAERVGPSGHVFSTEIESKKLQQIRDRVAARNLQNVTLIEASESNSNLPAACCDAVFMRRVYHHFTHPQEINRSLFRALRPGGLLTVIDFPPSLILSLTVPLTGAPRQRGGHGVSKEALIQELTAEGFELLQAPPDWPGRSYCVLFRRPAAN
jgi:ubiquinone/menaquinone biosynthesis C-methylase UbiE